MPDVPSVNVGVSLPGEQLAIEIIRLITVMIVGQPPEVRKQMWEWYVEDMKAWRTLWGLNK